MPRAGLAGRIKGRGEYIKNRLQKLPPFSPPPKMRILLNVYYRPSIEELAGRLD